MEYIWMAMAGGAAAFPHCLGMCGGFALHLAGGDARASIFRQLLWHAGRIATYAFLGALAGVTGGMISLANWPWARNVPGYVAGGLMVLMGLFVLGVIPTRGPSQSREGGLFAAVMEQFFRKPTAASSLALGLATGFLPCPITIGFLGLSAAAGTVLSGIGIMVAMGVGSAWSLLILGLSGHTLRSRWKRWGAVLVGVTLVAMGSWTILRKAGAVPPLGGGDKPHSCCAAAEKNRDTLQFSRSLSMFYGGTLTENCKVSLFFASPFFSIIR